jgi:hypothetical protein
VFRRRWVLLAAVVLLATAATATTAYAAKITLTSKSLLGIKAAANALPQQLISDPFNSTNTAINLSTPHVATTGQPWTVLQGALQLRNGYLQCTTGCATANYGAAIINADLAKVTATVDVRSATGSGAAGLILNANQSATQAYAVWYDGGAVTLLRYDSGNVTYAPVRTVAVPPNNTDVPLSAVFNGTSYVVSFNSIVVMTYALPALDVPIFGANTYFGVVIYDDPNIVKMDDFEVKQ